MQHFSNYCKRISSIYNMQLTSIVLIKFQIGIEPTTLDSIWGIVVGKTSAPIVDATLVAIAWWMGVANGKGGGWINMYIIFVSGYSNDY